MTRTKSHAAHRALVFSLFLSALSACQSASAGAIQLSLVIDPATTAGAGIPAAGGFSVTSNRSGAGTWQLYAYDFAGGSYGIAQVKAQLIGTMPSINNRMTQTVYDTADDTGFKAGLTLLRSGTNSNPITASAELPGTQPYTIGGLGRTAGNYSTIPGAIGFAGTTNGQWGNYANVVGAPLFIAEGTYAGAAPTIDLANSIVTYYTSPSLTSSATSVATSSVNPLVSSCPLNGCVPPTVSNVTLDNVDPNVGLVQATIFASPPFPITWSGFTFDSYVGLGSGPANAATLVPNSSSANFSWNTFGSPPGTYKWSATASNFYGSGQGSITIRLTGVPEPTTLSLLFLASVVPIRFVRWRA